MNRDASYNYEWLNPVLAYLVPQRSALFGFSLALIALVILWAAVRSATGWQPFLFAGIVTGVMPVFHVHAYGTAVALSVFCALFSRRIQVLRFFIPALAIGISILVRMSPPANTSARGSNPSVDTHCIDGGWLS